MNTRKLSVIVQVAVLLFILPIQADAAETDAVETNDFAGLMSDGKVTLDFRYRYEFVDQENFDEDAHGSTLRTRLGFQSGVYRGWDFNIEVNDVRQVISNEFNTGGGTTPNRAGVYPVVADPKGTRLNQGYINYSGLQDWGFKVGRQRINLDNQRFVGAVAWRQTEQVFDAGSIDWGNDFAQVSFTYVQWVRRIFGVHSPVGKHSQDGTMFLNAAFKTPIGKAVGYYYHIDNEDALSFSTDTIGARLSGSQAINDDWSIRYEGEYAHQTDAGSNPVDISADYFHLGAFAVFGIYDFGLGWELLGGDNSASQPTSAAFRTPLATLHKFNGLADQFLATPFDGLDDKYLKFKATPGDFIIQAHYHDFQADDGGRKFGTELDLQFGYKFNKRFRGDFFIADFSGKNSFVDVTKIFVQATFKM